MSYTIRIATGHNQSGSLAEPSYPVNSNLIYPEPLITLSGRARRNGTPYITVVIGDRTPPNIVETLLSEFGFSDDSNVDALITVGMKNNYDRTTEVVYNGTVIYPYNPPFQRASWGTITLNIINLEVI